MLNYALLKNPTNWVIITVMAWLGVIFFNMIHSQVKG